MLQILQVRYFNIVNQMEMMTNDQITIDPNIFILADAAMTLQIIDNAQNGSNKSLSDIKGFIEKTAESAVNRLDKILNGERNIILGGKNVVVQLGYYDDNFEYVPGKGWDSVNQCYKSELEEEEYYDEEDYGNR